VEVLNQLGQKVKIIQTKQLLRVGLHRLTKDGRNDSQSRFLPGIHLVVVNFDGTNIFSKIVMLK